MKESIFHFVLALALLALTQNAQAESYKGTMERHDVKMEYSFSGGTVTNKQEPMLGGAPICYMTTFIEGECAPGATLTASCKKLVGLPKNKEVKITFVTTTKDGKVLPAQTKKGNNSVSISYTVPSNAQKVQVEMSYFSHRVGLNSVVEWKVTGGASSSSVKKTLPVAQYSARQDGDTFKGTLSRQDQKIEFSIEGITVVREDDPTFSGNDPKNGNYFQHYKAIVRSGKTIKVNCKQLKGNQVPGILIEFDYYDKPSFKGGLMVDNSMRTSREKTKSSTVQEKKSGEVSISYLGDTGDWIVLSWYLDINGSIHEPSVSPSSSSSGPRSFNFDDKAPDENCPTCKKGYSHYEFGSVTGKALMGCRDKKSNFQKASALYPLYYHDYIQTYDYTKVRLNQADEEDVLSIMENSLVGVENMGNGKDRWTVYKGKMMGKYLKHIEPSKKPEFKLSNCTAYPQGTIFVLEDDGNTSCVYLLQGAMEVVADKTKKKVNLVPGQMTTVSSKGQQNVQTFDVKAVAKQYSISQSEISATSSTPTSGSNNPSNTGSGNGMTTVSSGSVFKVGNLSYKVLSANTVELTYDKTARLSGHIKIPSTVSSQGKTYQVVGIGKKVFYDQREMTSVEIPSSVVTIEEDAFYNTGISSVVVPADNVKIVKYAFRCCRKLVTATVKGRTPHCSFDAFYGCSSMKELFIRDIKETSYGKNPTGTKAVIKRLNR